MTRATGHSQIARPFAIALEMAIAAMSRKCGVVFKGLATAPAISVSTTTSGSAPARAV
jgi:hypothetical protein